MTTTVTRAELARLMLLELERELASIQAWLLAEEISEDTALSLKIRYHIISDVIRIAKGELQ
jgi:hypothetical protein